MWMVNVFFVLGFYLYRDFVCFLVVEGEFCFLFVLNGIWWFEGDRGRVEGKLAMKNMFVFL